VIVVADLEADDIDRSRETVTTEQATPTTHFAAEPWGLNALGIRKGGHWILAGSLFGAAVRRATARPGPHPTAAAASRWPQRHRQSVAPCLRGSPETEIGLVSEKCHSCGRPAQQ
jgi:hypothetical protein